MCTLDVDPGSLQAISQPSPEQSFPVLVHNPLLIISRSDRHSDLCLSRRTQSGPDGAPHNSMNDHVHRDPDCDFYLHEHARDPP